MHAGRRATLDSVINEPMRENEQKIAKKVNETSKDQVLPIRPIYDQAKDLLNTR